MWRFEIFRDEDNGWHWRLIQRDTVITLESITSFPTASEAEHEAMLYRAEIGMADVRVITILAVEADPASTH